MSKYENRLFDTLEVGSVIGLFLFLIGMAIFWNCNQQNDRTVVNIPIQTSYDWDDALKDELKVVCIDGFEYYFASITSWLGGETDKSRAVLAPKFDKDTALPKRCIAEGTK